MNSTEPRSLRALVILNYVMAGLSALGLLLLAALLAFGIYSDIQEGADDTIYGVIGVLFIALPFLAGFPIHLTAALGLHRRTPWGYGCHIAGTIVAAFTCVGLIYTVIGLILALDSSFRAEYPLGRQSPPHQ